MDAKLKGNKVGKRKHWKKQEKLIPWLVQFQVISLQLVILVEMFTNLELLSGVAADLSLGTLE